MTWLLTIILILPGQTVSLPVGLMAQAVSRAAPGSVVGFTCTPPERKLS